jgi:hypothetical protein
MSRLQMAPKGKIMSSPEVKHIADPMEIPPGSRYVLVMAGAENGQMRHSRGVVITVAVGGSEASDESTFQAAVDSAKTLAQAEDIPLVFVCK